jgi:hypothetical protein
METHPVSGTLCSFRKSDDAKFRNSTIPRLKNVIIITPVEIAYVDKIILVVRPSVIWGWGWQCTDKYLKSFIHSLVQII